MASDDQRSSVRVEVEGLITPDLDAPEMLAGNTRPSAWAGVVTLAVLLVLGFALVVLGSDDGDAIADELAQTEAEAALALASNGVDFNSSIRESLGQDDPDEEVARLLDISLSAVEPFEAGLVGLTGSELSDVSRVPELWYSRAGERWTQIETVVSISGERSEDSYSWEVLLSNGPLLVLGGSIDGDMSWFTSSDAARWDRLEMELPAGVVVDRPLTTTEASVLFAATNPTRSQPPSCSNTGPEFFVLEFGLEDGGAEARFGDDFLISQRLNGSFPIAADGSSLGALDVGASFGEVTPCAEAVTTDRLESWFRLVSLDDDVVESFAFGSKLGFDQLAAFRGSVTLSNQEWLLFSDSGSLSLLNPETREWKVVTSPVFADQDVNDDGWLSTSRERLFFISGTELTAVSLVGETTEVIEETSTFAMGEETLDSELAVRVLWASDEKLIFSTGNESWIVDTPPGPDTECDPVPIEDVGGAGNVRASC